MLPQSEERCDSKSLTVAEGDRSPAREGGAVVELTEREVVEGFARGMLPESWAFRLKRPIRPLYATGQLILVRRGVRAGALVCVVHAGRLRWRRALVLGDRRALLRAEISPFDDGWVSEIAGSVEPEQVLQRLAERTPSGWTRLWWRAACIRSRLPGVWPKRCWPLPGRFHVRTLTSADREQYFGLQSRAGSGAWEAAGAFPPATTTVLGLFCGETLVGRVRLTPKGGAAICYGLWVDPSYRGRGGGTLLCRVALGEARALGIRRVEATVHVRNFASLRSAARAGFRQTGQWITDPNDRLLASELQQLKLEAWLL